jgi:hypothetical protein
MLKASRIRTYGNGLFIVFMTLMMSACWSARCPRETCRVRVEHRHGESYYRPREAFSWMWTPRYKHVRVGANGQKEVITSKPWYKIIGRKKPATTSKPR